jgi:hypothetical protein
MLDTIRSCATEQLYAGGEHDAVRDRQAAYYRALTVTATPTLSRPVRPQVLDGLQLEHDNLRVMLRWLLRSFLILEVASVGRRARMGF